ncbi:MAG: 16S rRNA (uracil(1498)-N(3))-methyltransferase [Rhodoferax sp.]|nr:16S rRNA (uracil(1498)-N(3))-methyltransferase [Rhodoferax sp.]
MSSVPRFHCAGTLAVGQTVSLAPGVARHVQVLRLQPGDAICLFNGSAGAAAGTVCGEYDASILSMGRQDVQVSVIGHRSTEREAERAIHLVIGMPANERMDWLVEKATELGVTSIQPLMTERSVVRLSEERARRRTEHWTGIAIAACEQCGRNQVPVVWAASGLAQWANTLPPGAVGDGRFVLSLQTGSTPLRRLIAGLDFKPRAVTLLVGPEGGLSATEEATVISLGFAPVSLGTRVLRSETAALAGLTLLG